MIYGACDRVDMGVVRGSTVTPGDRTGWVSGPLGLTAGVYVRLLLYGLCKDPC